MEKPYIGVVHFNAKTWKENETWRESRGYKGCVYGVDKRTESIPYGEPIIVIEMNNDTDEIMGIGKIMNVLREENRSMIYDDENYNRIVYRGEKRSCRKELLISNKDKIEYLERILFKGSRHFKRGHGVIKIPHDRLACIYKERIRKQTQCGKCGGVGHNKRSCKEEGRVRVKQRSSEKKLCPYCGVKMKGHMCGANRIDVNKKKEIIDYLKSL